MHFDYKVTGKTDSEEEVSRARHVKMTLDHLDLEGKDNFILLSEGVTSALEDFWISSIEKTVHSSSVSNINISIEKLEIITTL